MAVHHATLAKANKAGMVMTDDPKEFLEYAQVKKTAPKDTVRAHYPKFNLVAYGVGGPAAFEQMAALIRIKSHDDTRIILHNQYDPFEVMVLNHDRTLTPYRGYAVPVDAYMAISALDQGNKRWLSTEVPKDGAEAHKLGFSAGDNPFDEPEEEDEESDWAVWNAAFDEAIEADDGEPEDAGGSVVKEVYRIRYAEAGHPNHCGDWLAETLNNFVLGKAQSDLEVFERICNENGVTLTKYKREGNGWQGRLRMTGRNMLARVVYSKGVLMLPAGLVDGVTELRPTPEWLASKNYKVKRAAVAPVAVEAAPEPEVVNVEPAPEPEAPISRSEQMKKLRASKGKK